LAGICTGAIFTLIPLYISEIADSSVRNTLNSFFLLSVNFGTLLMFILGTYFDYTFLSYFQVYVPIAFAVVFLFFPETPYYLLKHGKTKKAEYSVKFFHNCRHLIEMPDVLKSNLLVIAKKVEEDARTQSKVLIGKELSELFAF
jgi:MFS family permease